jgi:hypothetical protein
MVIYKLSKDDQHHKALRLLTRSTDSSEKPAAEATRKWDKTQPHRAQLEKWEMPYSPSQKSQIGHIFQLRLASDTDDLI